MKWTTSICVLVTMVIHSSSQDMVVSSSTEPATDNTTSTSETPSMKSKLKPTIRALHINSTIKYRYATTLVSSRVVNPSNESAEVTFTVTLPESAFISEFLMDVKGKVYKAYVKEKEEAKADYNAAVAAGQFAGHVAQQARDSNQFTVSVNIESNGKVTFNLTYEELLSRNLGSYSNVINIDPQQIVKDMSVTVDIQEPTAITNLKVVESDMSNEAVEDNVKPNEEAKIVEVNANHKQIIWTPTPEQQKRQKSTGISGQFIVKYDVDRKENSQQILVDEGYFVHFFAPEDLPRLKKHVVFVLDYSGSMAGRKLEQLKDAMDKILSDLSPADFFSIVIFQSFVEAWSPKTQYTTATEYLSPWETENVAKNSTKTNLDTQFVVAASPENVALARTYLANYSDLGATNIMGGLRTGLELVSIGSKQWENDSDPAQPVIVFLTDGQPNVEEYDTDAIINKTKPLNVKKCPIFSLAFGYGADYNFLRKLSLYNDGFARNIYEAADASDQLKNFYQTVASPLLTNVTFTYLPGQVDNSTSTKKEFPVFFKGSEIIVSGKINKNDSSLNDSETIGELTARASDGVHTYPIVLQSSLKPENSTFGHLEKAWAYLRIKQLLDKIDSTDDGNEKNETRDLALDLALKYSFVTPLTSLVVVKPNESESAVDTTKVKPGSVADNYGFSGAAGGFSGAAPQLALMAYPIAPPGYQTTSSHLPSYPQSQSAASVATTSVSLAVSSIDVPDSNSEGSQDNSTRIVSLNEVKWLQEILNNSSDAESVPISIKGHQYLVALNETDSSFGECQVHSQAGHCRHIKYCALKDFKEDVDLYEPYHCDITGDFLGVCCPF